MPSQDTQEKYPGLGVQEKGSSNQLSLLPYDLLLSYLPEQQWIEKGLFGYWGQNFALNEIPYDQDQKGIQLKESTPLKL